MTWLAWRQHRTQLGTSAALVAALAAVLLLLGQRVYDNFRHSGLADCLASGGDCDVLSNAFDARFANYTFLMILVLVCPLLVGMFWGAPLVARDLENGTHRFAWTQGVTRRRWVVTKLALSSAAIVAAASAFTAVASWFAHPFNEAFSARLDYGLFDVQGVVPVAYTLFAFAVGVAAGAVLRRTMPAMAVTLLVFVTVRGSFDAFVRTHLLPTRTVSYPALRPPPMEADGLVVSTRILDRTGAVFSSDGNLNLTPGTLRAWCPDLGLGVGPGTPVVKRAELEDCIASIGLRTVDTIHPASQFWSFQLIESLLFASAAAALLGFAVWWVLRRVS